MAQATTTPTSLRKAQRRFLHHLRDLVLEEAEATRRRIHRQWQRPLPARVADGHAIENVRLVQHHANGQLDLECRRNRSRFRPGDVLCLNRGAPFAHPRLTVILEADDETHLRVSGDTPTAWDLAGAPPDGWVLDTDFLDVSGYILGALNEVGDTLVGRERILPLLRGRARPQIDPGLYARGLEMGEALGLNWSQSDALANAYAADLAYLIQGPPGTGKTRVLAHLVQALVSDGERVLVCAFTHRAINNALNTLHRLDPTVPAAKIGRPARADDLFVDNYDSFHTSPLAERSGGYAVGATPFAPHTKRLRGVEFDTVIFDEASQITLPLAIMGMLAAQKYIFIGDQAQLPPVLTTRHSGNPCRDSVFAHLAGGNFETMLTETYRLNDALTAFPSRHFYDEQLAPAPGVAARRIAYPIPPSRLRLLLDPDEPMVFWDLDHQNNTTYSYKEAYAVVDLITTVLGTGLPAREIGVVAPYRAQGRLIRNLLGRRLPAETRRRLVVDTVERMQGQERELVILSLTTSNPSFATQLADFFFQPERLNVAITRPRSKLIIVGSRAVLRAQPATARHQAAVRLLGSLLDSCTPVPARLLPPAPAVAPNW